jgi:GxxExxY protein
MNSGKKLCDNLRQSADQKSPETFAIIGAAMEVHRELHNGFLEAVYQDALAVEFSSRQIPFEREKLLQVRYKGGILPSFYKADFICFGNVLVECKALQAIGGTEQAQVLNYLRITGLTHALLLNFGARSLEHKRLIFSSQGICDNPCKSAEKIQ